MRRFGLSVPLFGVPLHEHREIVQRAEADGYTDLWSLEVDGTDAFSPLALAAGWTEGMRLGTAIAGTFTRGPMTLAMSAAAMAEAAPGRFVLGLGTSSSAIAETWNGIPFAKPYTRTRDVFRAIRTALAGERVTVETSTTHVTNFRLTRPVSGPVPIYLAALRERMLRLAGAEADGVIINWLAPEDVPTVLKEVRAGAREAGRDPDAIEVVSRLFVCVSDDEAAARQIARRYIAAYLTVPVYTEFHRWLGRGAALQPMLDAWSTGDRRGALAAIPDEVVDAVFIAGNAATCRARIEAYVDAGVQTPVVYPIPLSTDWSEQGRESRAAVAALIGRT
ncbi:MAG: LLM class F420-dependent oxidoreductase [Dehalococcoidia bacterium]